MKRIRNLIFLGILFLLLLGSYAYIKTHPPGATKEAAKEPPAKPLITAVSLSANQLVKIDLKSKAGTLTLLKKGSDWGVDYPYPIELAPIPLYGVVSNFTNLAADQVIEDNPKDLTQYGLATPGVTAVATLKDGTIKRYFLGEKTPTGTGYYFKAEADPRVFLIAIVDGERFKSSLIDLRERDIKMIDTQNLNRFKLARLGQKTIEIVPNDQMKGAEGQFQLSNLQMIQPYQTARQVSGDQFKKVVEGLAGLTSIQEFIDDNPANLAKYGLQPAQAELTVGDGAAEFRLLIGKKKNEQNYYCKLADSPTVFTVTKSSLTFLNLKSFDLVDKFAYIVNIDDVARIKLEAGGKVHLINIEHKIKKSGNQDQANAKELKIRVDGKAIAEKPFKKYYQSLIGLMVEAENDQPVLNGKPDLITTYYLTQGSQREVEVKYIPYNQDFYTVVRNGRSEFVIAKDQVQQMLQNLDKLIQGKLKVDD